MGIGQITLSGSGSTKVERDFTDGNTVLFKLSGELLFPDVRFIPNFNGGGTITILGSGDESISRPYKEQEDYSVLHLDLKHMHVHLTLVLVQFILVSTILMERQLKVQVDSVVLLVVDCQVAEQKNASLNPKEYMYV